MTLYHRLTKESKVALAKIEADYPSTHERIVRDLSSVDYLHYLQFGTVFSLTMHLGKKLNEIYDLFEPVK
jgi:hypothetical protein